MVNLEVKQPEYWGRDEWYSHQHRVEIEWEKALKSITLQLCIWMRFVWVVFVERVKTLMRKNNQQLYKFISDTWAVLAQKHQVQEFCHDSFVQLDLLDGKALLEVWDANGLTWKIALDLIFWVDNITYVDDKWCYDGLGTFEHTKKTNWLFRNLGDYIYYSLIWGIIFFAIIRIPINPNQDRPLAFKAFDLFLHRTGHWNLGNSPL